MMTAIVNVFEEAGVTVSKKTETTLLRTPNQTPLTSPLVIEAAGQRYKQTTVFVPGRPYLRDCRRYAGDQRTGPTRVSILRSVQAGAVRYGDRCFHAEGAQANVRRDGDAAVCVTWTLGVEHFAALHSAHRKLLLRIVGFHRRQRTGHRISYAKALKNAQCKSVETTIHRRCLVFAGAVQRAKTERQTIERSGEKSLLSDPGSGSRLGTKKYKETCQDNR